MGGTHSGFGDDALPEDPESVARQQQLTRRYVVSFLRRRLARDARFLRPKDAAAQGPDAELRVR
jgi:hypothetical protein